MNLVAQDRPSYHRKTTTWRQCRTVIYHTWLLKAASKTTTLLEILLPIVAVGMALIYPYMVDSKRSLQRPSAPSAATQPNYSASYLFDPIYINSPKRSSYLTSGFFVPMSQIMVAPNSFTTVNVARRVFQCVLELAGYSVRLEYIICRLQAC